MLNVLRWIAVLPGAFAGGWAAWIVISIVERLGITLGGIDPRSWYGRLFVETVSGLAMGVAFVYAGTRIAPGNRDRVCLVLAAAAVLVILGLLVPAVAKPDLWAIWSAACAATGAGAVAVASKRGEIAWNEAPARGRGS